MEVGPVRAQGVAAVAPTNTGNQRQPDNESFKMFIHSVFRASTIPGFAGP
jgi:hypothetical protein